MVGMSPTPASFITPDALLSHWQAHRRLTRRTIEAFPEERLFLFSIGGMRTFGELAMEMITMGAPMLRGLTSGQWDDVRDRAPRPKQDLLKQWDEATAEIDTLWKKIPAEKFHETATAFGQFTAPLHDLILYVIDNEIHHRGQAYVYLRALGVEPPPFYDRS
jgi:uncharacterized damage-inducible protein DinB